MAERIVRAINAGSLAIALLVTASLASAAKSNGEICSDKSECTSGFCADGVCCDLACDGTCEACVAKLKQTGKDTGKCGPTRTGTDPDSDCDVEAQSTCGKTGQCDGSSAKCQLYPFGTSKGATLCVLGNVQGSICLGDGNTSDLSQPVPCDGGKYLCKPDAPDAGACSAASPCPGHCPIPCATSADCAKTTDVCLGGSCVAKRDTGAACDQSSECASGVCADGVCCDKDCAGQCEACNLAGKLGVCSAVNGEPVAPRSPCAGAAPCQGICDGPTEACSYPGEATSCGTAAVCEGDSIVPADRCDGTGQCASPPAQNCGDYGCDATALSCFTSCTTDGQCAGGRKCDVAAGACNPVTNTCADDWSVKAPDGTVSSCDGYRCAAGKCQQQCSTGVDCKPGFNCVSARCELASDAGTGPGGKSGSSDSSGGCGCRSARNGFEAELGLAALALALGALRRRRIATGIRR